MKSRAIFTSLVIGILFGVTGGAAGVLGHEQLAASLFIATFAAFVAACVFVIWDIWT